MKKDFKKVLSIGIVMSMLLTGCGAGANDVAKEDKIQNQGSEDKKVITYYTWSEMEAVDKAVVDEFNKIDPNLQVELKTIESDSYDNKIQVLLSGGSDIDLFAIRAMAGANDFAKNGVLLETTEYLNNSKMDLASYGSLIEDVTIDNKYYSLPRKSQGWYLFYNKDIFDKEGIPYPGQMTWSEYADLAKQLTKGSGNDKQWGGYWAPWLFNFMAIQSGEYLIDDSLEMTQKSLELYNQLYNIDKSHMSYADMTATASYYLDEFENGGIAMLPQGDWVVSMISEDEAAGKSDVNWDMAPMPVFEDVEPGTTVGGFSTVGISSTSKNPDEAFKFLEFMCGEQGAIISAKNGVIGAYNVPEAKDEFINATQKESTKVMFESKLVQEQLAIPNYSRFIEVFKQNADLYILGEKTIEEALDGFQKDRELILKN